MKLTGILCLIAFLHVSAGTRAQTVTYSAKTTPLVTVFAAIEKQTGYVFFYNSRDLQGAVPVTVNLHDAPLKEALQTVLTGQPVTFDIQGNTIVITRAEPPTPPANSAASAPPGDIHGHITDSAGAPLAGASVSVKGTRKGTSTDSKGNFDLKGVDNNSTLIVSYAGFESQEIRLDGRNTISVQLRQGATQLLDVVVNKGYYSVKERDNTGDVTTVTGATIQEQPVSDPILALEGRVPGLYIQQASGIPGAYSQISIMGQNSIANGNDPLYIIDGVPFSSTSLTIPNFNGGAVGAPGNPTFNTSGLGVSPFNSLNPADIESIVVLKDADATAIYGSRGANGVILITTKKGKVGSTRVDLNVYTGGGEVTRMMHMLNTTQYLAMRREAFQNDGLTVPSIITNPADYNYDIDGVWDTTRYTNWQKVLIGNTSTFTNVQGSVSGGNANTQFLVGGGYGMQGTPYIGDYYDDKIMGNASVTHTSSDQRFHLQLGISYVYDNNKMPTGDFTSSSLTLAPDAPALFDKSGNLNWQIYNGTATFGNPAAATYQNAKAATDNLLTDLNLSYEIVPGLKLLSTFGYNHDEMNQINYNPASAQAPPYNTNPSYRSALVGNNTSEKWIVEPQLSYQKGMGAGRIEALIGATFEQNTDNYYGLSGSGYTSDALIPDLLAASTLRLSVDNNILYRYNAIYGRVGYNWNEKYLINLTARRDGSSRFGPGKQFGNFGAGGVGWIFSKENFIQKNLSFLSYGKLRASYGITGNDQITDYQYLSSYSPISTTYEGLTGLYPTKLTNAYFAWEVVKKLEGGLDIGFLKDKILFSVVYYRNRTGNQLVGYSLPYITGFNSVQFNLPAVVQNEGLELTLNTVNIKTENFSWSTGVNLTIPSNKLVAFPNIQSFSSYANTYVVGKSLFIKERFHCLGVNDTTGIYEFASAKNGPTYNPTYPTDLRPTKPITQQFYGGLNNSFKYRGFQLDIFLQFVEQRALNYRAAVSYPGPGYFNTNCPTVVLNRWQKPGDISNFARFSTDNAADPSYALLSSDFSVSDASFIRLKNMALSYQLTGGWQKSMHLQNVRLYLQCQNLFTITKYLGMDPETGASVLPPLRMITGGLKVSL
jgi:TonB-linked SusC/RagA family outer membrane protein